MCMYVQYFKSEIRCEYQLGEGVLEMLPAVLILIDSYHYIFFCFQHLVRDVYKCLLDDPEQEFDGFDLK